MDGYEIDWERLDRYVTGRGSPEERAAAEQWVNTDPELRALAEVMRTSGRAAGASSGSWDTRTAWQRVHGRMRLMGRGPLRVVPGAAGRSKGPAHWPPRHRASVWPPVAAAAAAVVVLASSILFIARSGGPSVDPTRVAVEIHEFTTDRRQRSIVSLPDGSRAILAPETRLRVPDTYAHTGSGARDVFLEGQAHFEVEHDAARPFRVHAANGTAEDLGTEFVVTSYPETDGMEVVVASGAVALYARPPEAEAPTTPDAVPADASPSARPRPLVTLTRGDLARLGSAGTATVTRGVDVAARTAWTQGTIVFDGTLLADALPVLQRWYDIEIGLTDSALANRRLTATFGGEPLPQVLELLALSLDLRVEHTNQTVTLTPTSPAEGSR